MRFPVLALDASLTSTGWAKWHSGTDIRYGTLKSGSRRGVERLVWIRDEVLRLASNAALVIIEGYAYARANQAHQIGELGGVLRVALDELNENVVVVSPMARAKYATGKGNAKKELVLVSAVRRLDYSGSSNDEADALWILQMALGHYGLPGAVEVPAAHQEALKKVSWPALA